MNSKTAAAMSAESLSCDQTIPNGSVMLYTCTFGLYNLTTPWDDVQSLFWPALTTLLTEQHVGPKEGTCIIPAIFSGTKRRDADAQRIDVPSSIASGEGSQSGGTGRGSFFAIDRRAWARVCKLNINAMTAYLVLARGTGHDQRTTSWSVNAIETHTGIGRPRAQKAIDALVQAGLVRITRGGTKPKYSIIPAHEVPHCEGYPPPEMDAAEQNLFDRLVSGATFVPANLRTIAAALVKKGWARSASKRFEHCHAIPYDAEAAVKPDWIWLPNDIIDGAAGETAPVELVRQTQNAPTLRLLIDLYHAQTLASDGGIHWRSIRQQFARHKVGEHGSLIVYGFQRGKYATWGDEPFVAAHMTGELETVVGPDQKEDRGWSIFWGAWHQLVDLGLVVLVEHLVEADNDVGNVIHPYAASAGGEAPERRVGRAAHEAGMAMLTEAQQNKAEANGLHLAPVPAHITEVQMVGIARLRYRPRTSATAAWFTRMAEWNEIADRYDELAAKA
jgi:hypothetical protein